MASNETSRFGVPEPSFARIIGVEGEDAKQLRAILDDRLLTVLNRFPFSDPDTLELPILRITSLKDEVFVLNFPKAVSPVTVEKIMDNVIISRSSFTGEYKYGPKNYSRGGERGKNHSRTHKTLTFPVVLKDLREYFVAKGIDIKHHTDKDGKLVKTIESIEYFAKLKEDGIMVDVGEFAS